MKMGLRFRIYKTCIMTRYSAFPYRGVLVGEKSRTRRCALINALNVLVLYLLVCSLQPSLTLPLSREDKLTVYLVS